MIHILHIGKTGGTAIKAALAGLESRHGFKIHDHATTLKDCPEQDTAFFVVRHPADRFVSSFNSRLRKGRPRYDYPWSARETLAFSLFHTPCSLAVALGSRNPLRRLAARFAMGAIEHVRTPLSYWLGCPQEIASRPNLIIGTMQTLASDYQRLVRAAGIKRAPPLPPRESLAAHGTPQGMKRHLSQAAIGNLERWYKQDLELYETCLRLRETSLDADGHTVDCDAPLT